MLIILANIVWISVASVVILKAWRYRAEAEVTPYLWFMLGQILWSVGYLFEIVSPEFETKVFWDNFQYIGGALLMISLLVFSFAYSGIRFRGIRLFYWASSVPIIIFLIEVFLHPLGPIARPNARLIEGDLNGALIYDISPQIYALMLYAVLLYAVAVVILLTRVILGHMLYLFQSLLVIVGVLVPLVGICLSITVLRDSPYRDITPVTFTLCDLLLGFGLFYFKLFDIVPFARNVLVENLIDGVVVLDAQNRVCDFNNASRSFSQKSNLGVGDALSEAFPYVMLPEALGDAKDGFHQEALLGERHVDVRLVPVRDHRGMKRGLLAVLRDITNKKLIDKELQVYRESLESLVEERTAQLNKELAERLHLEEQFRQAQKMEAVGRLAGGVAHDFNNLLTAIMGNAELLSLDFGGDERIREPLDIICSVSAQAAGLTQQLLAFSRKQVLQPKILNINEVIGGIEKMLSRLMGEDIALCLELDPSLGSVKADPVQFQQVIMNLAVNARDAMPTGGRFTLSTGNTVVKADGGARFLDLSPGPYVMLTVKDTGVGMSPETLLNVFDPFFTTKGVGKGTGLGLATVHGIVRQSGGCIYVESKEGEGATFTILLPMLDVEQGQEDDAVPIPTSVRGSGETILVVEDEAFVLNLVRRVLTRAGYRVLEASDVSGALKTVQGYPGRIDLLLTDVVLPGTMTGKDLAEELATIKPNIGILFMSGYTGEKIAAHGILEDNLNFIAKPFSPEQLLNKVGEILKQNESGKSV